MNIWRIAKDFPVICVGGSAGGLDAYTRLILCPDMMETGQQRYAAKKRWGALPSHRNSIQPSSLIGLRAQLKAGVAILFFHPKMSLEKLYEFRTLRNWKWDLTHE